MGGSLQVPNICIMVVWIEMVLRGPGAQLYYEVWPCWRRYGFVGGGWLQVLRSLSQAQWVTHC